MIVKNQRDFSLDQLFLIQRIEPHNHAAFLFLTGVDLNKVHDPAS